MKTSTSAVSGPEIDSVSGQKLTTSVSAISEAETDSVSGQKLTLQFLFTPVPETEVPYILNF